MLLYCEQNARMSINWAGQTFTLLLYRQKRPYDIAPPIYSRIPGTVLTLHLIHTSLISPQFHGSYCNWRLFHEMFPSTLDRPESSMLLPMPNTEADLLNTIFATPQKNERLWAIHTSFPKYDRLFFSTHGRTLNCLLCGRTFSSPILLARSCLGYPYLCNENDIENAQSVSIVFGSDKIHAHADPSLTFNSFWAQNSERNNQPKKVQNYLSAIYDLSLPPTNPQSVVRHAYQLLNADTNPRIPVIIVYAITLENDLAIGAKLWLCRPITENLPSGLTINALLDKFHSLLFQGLLRTIIKEAKPIQSFFGNIFHLRQEIFK